jgi:hypothetical protein
MPLRAHPRVRQNLRHRILRGRLLLNPICIRQCADKIRWVVVGNELQSVCDAIYEILLADDGHGKPDVKWLS